MRKGLLVLSAFTSSLAIRSLKSVENVARSGPTTHIQTQPNFVDVVSSISTGTRFGREHAHGSRFESTQSQKEDQNERKTTYHVHGSDRCLRHDCHCHNVGQISTRTRTERQG